MKKQIGQCKKKHVNHRPSNRKEGKQIPDIKTFNDNSPFYSPTYGERLEEGFNMIHKNDMT